MDAWTSIAQQSYITITASVINYVNKIKCYVLDTSEITTSHTSENLLMHICGKLEHFNIRSKRSTLNTLNGELEDCDDDEFDDRPNYLVEGENQTDSENSHQEGSS